MNYSICNETNLTVCEVFPNLLVREDGYVKNTTGHGNVIKGWHSGSTDMNGYKLIGIPKANKSITIHRLVALAFIPNSDNKPNIDHRSGDKTDNRVGNLRWVYQRENCQNLKIHRDNEQLPGTTYRKDRVHLPKPWQSQVRVNGKQIHLGYYSTQIEANQVYINYLNTHIINQ